MRTNWRVAGLCVDMFLGKESISSQQLFVSLLEMQQIGAYTCSQVHRGAWNDESPKPTYNEALAAVTRTALSQSRSWRSRKTTKRPTRGIINCVQEQPQTMVLFCVSPNWLISAVTASHREAIRKWQLAGSCGLLYLSPVISWMHYRGHLFSCNWKNCYVGVFANLQQQFRNSIISF